MRLFGAHQVELPVEREIAEVDGAEPPERDDAADRLVVFRDVDGRRRISGARGVRRRLPGERRLNDLRGRRHDPPVQALDLQLVARFGDGVLRLRELGVFALEERVGVLVGLSVGAVIDKVCDRDPLRELAEAADVIAVVMGRNQVIDARHACALRRGGDAVGVACGAGASVA